MLQLKQIISEPQEIIERLKTKNFDAAPVVNEIIELDKKRRTIQKDLDDKKSEQNNISKQIGQLFKEGKQQEVEALKAQSVKLKDEISVLESEFEPIDKKMYELIVKLPNLRIRAFRKENQQKTTK
jgi:seryl-tRNA synthetase